MASRWSKRLENLERSLEDGEYRAIMQIEAIEAEVAKLPDSEEKRKFEIRLAQLNGLVAAEAVRARQEHLAEARKLKKRRF